MSEITDEVSFGQPDHHLHSLSTDGSKHDKVPCLGAQAGI